MTQPLRTIAACLLSTSLLAVGSAQAQNMPFVDRLVAASADLKDFQTLDPDARAIKRYAIVIGNSNYSAIPDLDNAHADAKAMQEFLRSQGYLIEYHEDISKRGFEDVLRRVLFDVDSDTEVVVFYAGHGFQIGSDNYLVPTDADLDSVYDVPFEAVSLGSLVGIIGARARLQVVILDSCRDNPFAGRSAVTRIGNELREARTGFSSQSAPLNSMLIYSTSPGSVAFDGEGPNSPFTASLVEEASARPDDLVKDVFEGVRRSVFDRTSGRQVPWDSSTLVEPASFGLGAALSRPIAVSSTGLGQTRGLARVVDPPEEAAQVQLAALTSATIEADFLPEVEIGTVLKEALNLTDNDSVRITSGPATGRLVWTDPDGIQRDMEGETLTARQLDELMLVNRSVQIPARSLSERLIPDALDLTVNGEAGQVALNLIPDPCDFQAGDHLDPDGMGITRYPNELQPEVALAACEAAIARDPANGRFYYQKGRAHLALLQTEAADAAFAQARDLGHSRAWYALGSSALNKARTTGGLADVRAPDEVLQLYARGVSEGDPYAYHSLGWQLLNYGGTDDIELEGYDLLVRAMEVGHTFAMNGLASFYLDEDGEYYDADRGLRYLEESAAREDIYGYNALGLVYYRGRAGQDVDMQRAFDLFTQAAEGGQPKAPYNLGRMYVRGQAPEGANLEQALRWFAIGTESGDAQAAATAASVLRQANVDGYDSFDGAVFAAKGAALLNNRRAAQAREELESLPQDVIDGGAQRLINDLGGDLVVDGAFGAGSRREMDAVLARLGGGAAQSDPVERIIQLGALYWQQSSFRVDLY